MAAPAASPVVRTLLVVDDALSIEIVVEQRIVAEVVLLVSSHQRSGRRMAKHIGSFCEYVAYIGTPCNHTHTKRERERERERERKDRCTNKTKCSTILL